MKLYKQIIATMFLGLGLTACEDMLDMDSDLYVYADGENLSDATDTIYSVVGIMSKVQRLADRTVLLGEVRGDLVEVTDYASDDLRDLSLFRVDNNNQYNNPRDYYAVINNCNYFLAHADTELKNNRGEYIFQKEYAAVKAYRAWTYLQLALIYGSVPFVTEPLVDMEVDEAAFPCYDIGQVCNYFISDLTPYADVELPGYGNIGGVDSRLCYFPIHVLLGELNLWAGNYREAALCYYRYISTRNGANTSWPLCYNIYWPQNATTYRSIYDAWTYNCFTSSAETWSPVSELVTMIPCDTVSASSGYSTLMNLWNTTQANDGFYSLTPSAAMISLSEAQVYCNQTTEKEISYVPNNLSNHRSGDLRLSGVWQTSDKQPAGLTTNDQRPQTQELAKFAGTHHVHLWRRSMIYLHMAEALNCAGFPEFAYRLLATGVNNTVMDSLSRAYPEHSAWLAQFDFPNTEYILRSENSVNYTTLGIHSRGSGFTEVNEYYAMPQGTLEEQMAAVEQLLVDEFALELAFEGHRFYDLMRVALRRGDPSFLASRVNSRNGSEVSAGIEADLSLEQNWYLPLEE